MFINYSKKADKIIIKTDKNESEWENTLNQVKKEIKKRYFICYKSKLWLDTEKKYDAVKQECHIILKMLKKCWYYLWKIHFILKLNINTVITQLQRTVTDLSEALIIQ